MAVWLRGRDCFLSRLKSLMGFQRLSHTVSEQPFPEALQDVDRSKWTKLDAKKVGITGSSIPASTWSVLKALRRKGFESYLVGGCVRDLILSKTPKDFDIITTANLNQIKHTFHRAMIVGHRFPICMVYIRGCAIEVSSFGTVANRNVAEEKQIVNSSSKLKGCSDKDFMLWRNSMQRDFTVNSLFLDPFMSKIYDYTGGMLDLMSLKLHTLGPAHLSFQEDCARILRGLRIAARLGLSVSKETESAMHEFSSSVRCLSKSRLMLELNYLLSYGAAMSSVSLLRRFNLLQILLPFHAACIDQQQDARNPSMLMELFSNLDKLVSCDKPADSCLWVGILAFHLALVHNPQDAFVVWTLASVFFKGSWKEGVKYAREHARVQVEYVPEISGFSKTKTDEELAKEVSQLVSLVHDSVCALTEADDNSELMSRYPLYPCSGLIFVPKRMGRLVARLYDVLVNDIESYEHKRNDLAIQYWLLKKGDEHETRFVLGKIILDTMNGMPVGATCIVEDERQTDNSAFTMNAIMVDKAKKRGLVLTSEREKENTKKQKVKRQSRVPEPRSSEDEKDEIADKNKRIVKASVLPDATTSRMHEKITDGKESSKNQEEVTQENLSPVEIDTYQDDAEITVKGILKKCRLVSANEKNAQEANPQHRILLHPMKDITLANGCSNPDKIVGERRMEASNHTLVGKKTKGQKKKVVNKEKKTQHSLSSLFR